jgi:hypothetical protein
MAKAEVFFNKHQWRAAISQVRPRACGRPQQCEAQLLERVPRPQRGGIAGLETAFRLSPCDPAVSWWQFFTCHVHAHLAQWEQAIEWRGKSIASNTSMLTSPPPTPGPGTTRKPKRPSRSCGNSMRTSLSRPGPASLGATIRPSARSISGSSKACARRACRRARRRRIEPAGPWKRAPDLGDHTSADISVMISSTG